MYAEMSDEAIEEVVFQIRAALLLDDTTDTNHTVLAGTMTYKP
jgi:hypothetical protein